MPQIFHSSTNTLAKVTLFGALVVLGGLAAVPLVVDGSPYVTRQGVTIAQPVPFSHEHHVAGLGIDCRYCHTAVEKAATAGVPPVATCYNCHAQIWTNAEILAPVRDGFRSNRPIRWTRVHDLPDYVYFDHSIHVAKGVGCVTCHGPIQKMQLTYQHASLRMNWCIDCHRNPEKFLRPKEEVFNTEWAPRREDGGQAALGARLVKEYAILSEAQMTSCSTCHR